MVNTNGLTKVTESMEQERKDEVDNAMIQKIQQLQEELAALKKGKEQNNVPKNHRMGKADPNRKYVLLSETMNMAGKVPQQQMDIATLLAGNMAVGLEYTEQEVFDLLVDQAGMFESLYGSKQDPTYLFRYYRGLDKKDGKHLGFIKRGFIRQIG